MMEILAQCVADRCGDFVPKGMSPLNGFAPSKDVFPAIIGGGGDFKLGDVRRLRQDVAQAANDYVLAEAKTSAGIGYTGQGAYVGVMYSPMIGGGFAHRSTTRYTLRSDDKWVNRWHPHDDGALAAGAESVKIGSGKDKRAWGMQGSKEMQDRTVHVDCHMPFEGEEPEPGSDIVGYVHGLPAAIVLNAKFGDVGIPMEVAYEYQTNKMSSCFQCSVYMQAAGYPASSVHLGRGESWIPPYPDHYREGQILTNAAYELLYSYFRYCRSIMQLGIDTLMKSNVAKSHTTSLQALSAYLADKWYGSYCADLILDASTVHDKDFMKALRAFDVEPISNEKEFKRRYDEGDRITV